jgi:acyl carrier protein
MHAALARLAPGGRYLDLCPRRSFDRPELGTLRLGPNQSLTSIDIAELVRNQPELASRLLRRAMEAADVAADRLPVTVFAASQTSRALRFMAQNRHVGRVCVDLEGAGKLEIHASRADALLLADRGAFVVCGSEPALQAAIGEWLRGQGATSVEVVSSTEDARARLDDGQRMAGWIHVAAEAGREPDALAQAPSAAGAQFRALVSLRDAVGSHGDAPVPAGDPVARSHGRDRAWETRLLVDRLLLSDADPSRGEARAVSISASCDTDTEPIIAAIGAALLGDGAPPQVVLLEEGELAGRMARAPSPMLRELESGTQSRSRSRLLRAEVHALSPPERRAAMQRLVVDELAGVLGMSEEERQAVDLGSRIDALGLDSLMTMELFMGMGRELELEIRADWFEATPSLAQVATVLVDRVIEGAA